MGRRDNCQAASQEVCQLVGRCDCYGEKKRASRGASLDRQCNSHQGGVKGINNECQLMERCDGHGGGVRWWRGVVVMKEV